MVFNRLEKHKRVYVNVDGASSGNPGKAGIGLSIRIGEEVINISKCIGIATNNDAEYRAIIEAFSFLKDKGIKEAIIMSDSQLVVNQIRGIYRVKSKKLEAYLKKIKSFLTNMDVDVVWIPREKNSMADKLAKQAVGKC